MALDPDGHAQNPYAPPQATSEPADLSANEEEDLETFVGRRSGWYLAQWKPALEGVKDSLGFNWGAFLFNGFWLAYRKMYRYAFIFGAIVSAESLLEEILFVGVFGQEEIPTAMARAVTLLTAVICGAFGNFWYLKHSRRKIREIRAQAPTPEARAEALHRVGGTSAGAVLVFILVFFALLGLAISILELTLYAG